MKTYEVIMLIALISIALVIFAWMYIRFSRYWNALTLFKKKYIKTRFKNMDTVFRNIRKISPSQDIWNFDKVLKDLSDYFIYQDQKISSLDFLKDTETTGLIISSHQTIVYESYSLGYDQKTKVTSWSMAKSFISTMVGIALDDRLIDSIEDPIDKYVDILSDTAYKGISIKNILYMASGVDFNEDYDHHKSDIRMIFFKDFVYKKSMASYLKKLNKKQDQGLNTNYISSDTFVLGLLIKEVAQMSVSQYFEHKIWKPMGAQYSAYWNLDSDDQEISFAGLNASLVDYLKFGNLFLLKGMRNNQQIIPKKWVEKSIQESHKPWLGDQLLLSKLGYGYQWWVPNDGENDYLALGVWGQYIYVNPKKEVVIVKTSTDPNYMKNNDATISFFRSLAHYYE